MHFKLHHKYEEQATSVCYHGNDKNDLAIINKHYHLIIILSSLCNRVVVTFLIVYVAMIFPCYLLINTVPKVTSFHHILHSTVCNGVNVRHFVFLKPVSYTHLDVYKRQI